MKIVGIMKLTGSTALMCTVMTLANAQTPPCGTQCITCLGNEGQALGNAILGCELEGEPPSCVPYLQQAWNAFYGCYDSSATLFPKYQVVNVVYAPPGNQTGNKSSVTYSDTFTAGTTTSNSSTWKVANTVSISGKISFIGSGSTQDSSTWSEQQGSSDSIAITTTDGQGYELEAPPADGVNHDNDVIWVMLNPAVTAAATFTTDTYPNPQVVTTGFEFDTSDPISETVSGEPNGPDVIELTVGQLKLLAAGTAPSSIPQLASSADRLNRVWNTTTGALTPSDYQQILNADPFAANPNLNPASSNRFDSLGINVDYIPSTDTSEQTYTLNYTTTSTAGQSATDSYSVSVAIAAGVNIGFAGVSMNDSATYSYTNSWSSKVSNGQTQSAQLGIYNPQPQDDYTGPTVFQVWKDNVYGTFVFYGVNN